MAMNNRDTTALSGLRKDVMAALVVLLAIGFVSTETRFLGANILI
jgi:hypothetical protein